MVEKSKTLMRMKWEQPYIEKIIGALHPSGEVLQVGFGQGFAADRIQRYSVKYHTIIEEDPEKAKEARNWAADRPNVQIIQDNWKNALPSLGTFDAIFFNEIPLSEQQENLRSEEDGNNLIKEGKELLALIESKFPNLRKIQYTDKQIDSFYQKIGSSFSANFSRFIQELRTNNQISDKQFQRALLKYNLEKEISYSSFPTVEPPKDESLSFLQSCLKRHMDKESRFSCFCIDCNSKFDHPFFFDEIITNPDIDYTEKSIDVDPPKDCSYYKEKEALVILVKKVN